MYTPHFVAACSALIFELMNVYNDYCTCKCTRQFPYQPVLHSSVYQCMSLLNLVYIYYDNTICYARYNSMVSPVLQYKN